MMMWKLFQGIDAIWGQLVCGHKHWAVQYEEGWRREQCLDCLRATDWVYYGQHVVPMPEPTKGAPHART